MANENTGNVGEKDESSEKVIEEGKDETWISETTAEDVNLDVSKKVLRRKKRPSIPRSTRSKASTAPMPVRASTPKIKKVAKGGRKMKME